jgi:hypothetical protein
MVRNTTPFKGFDRDKLMMMPRDKAASLAHEALNPINRLEGHEMVAAISLLFAAVVSRVGLDPAECHTLGMKMMRDQEFHRKANAQLQSLRDFAGIQVKGDKDVVVA